MNNNVRENEKRDVRLQVFVTQSMEEKLSNMAELMGLTKNELIRYAIAQVVGGWSVAMSQMKNGIDEACKKALDENCSSRT